MTEAGFVILTDCRRILADIAEAEAAAGGSYATPTGTLSITASALFGQMYVLPVVTTYLDTYSTMRAKTLFIDRTGQHRRGRDRRGVRHRPSPPTLISLL